MLDLTAGVIIGFGLAGCSFPMVVGALGKLVPENWRAFAFGAGTAAGSFGQFLFSPLAHALIEAFSWQTALLIFAGMMLLVLPLSLVLATPPAPAGATAVKLQSGKQALSEAFGHRSYVLLVLGFFTCGFQLAFVTVHLPSYLVDRGLGADIGAWTIALIGLFNIVGSLGSGWLSGRMPKRYLLSIIYFARALSIVGLHGAAGDDRLDADLRRGHRTALALDRAADIGAGGADVRHALARDAVRLRLLQPSGRRLPRRLARRSRVRGDRLLQPGLVAVGVLRRRLGGHQPADRREAGGAADRRGGIIAARWSTRSMPRGARRS